MTKETTVQDQLKKPVDEIVRSIYVLLANSRFTNTLRARPTGHGFIENELRFELNDNWMCSAVLNRSWILWYFRRPLLGRLGIEPTAILRVFPNANVTNRNEVTLRISDLATAYAVLGWLCQNMIPEGAPEMQEPV